MRVIIIGQGVVGLSAAYEIEKAGHEVLLLSSKEEPQASAGESRIFRLFHEDPRLEEEARKAATLWDLWEEELGQTLIYKSSLFLKGGWARRAGYQEILGRHPLSSHEALYALDLQGGVGLIGKTRELLLKNLRGQKEEALVKSVAQGRVVLLGGEEREADFIVVAAGCNTRKLMGKPLGKIMHHVRFLFPYLDDRRPFFEIPALINKDLSFYGVAEERGFALGLTEDRELGFIDPLGHNQQRVLDKFLQSEREATQEIVASLFPALESSAIDFVYCKRDERASDGYELEQSPGLFGISGNNLFKFAPLLGLLAREAIDRQRD